MTSYVVHNFSQYVAWLHVPILQNHIYAEPFSLSLEQFFRGVWDIVSWAIALGKSPNKPNS